MNNILKSYYFYNSFFIFSKMLEKNKTNGQFDAVTFDKKLKKIKIPYYNLGFVSKLGFDNN